MSTLFSPITFRQIRLDNRIVVSPMSQYRAKDGLANDWHLVHLGRFAQGGAGLVITEATAVQANGLRTLGDLGIWNDAQAEALEPVCDFIKAQGAVAGIQLSHAGRKASERRPWHHEAPLDHHDLDLRGEAAWPVVGPSPIPYAPGWPSPIAMTEQQIGQLIEDFASAGRRAVSVGFDVFNIYAGHGFLIHQFLSPLANQRTDRWGGSAQGRTRLAVEVALAVREAIGEDRMLTFRLSATDWLPGGLSVDDTVQISRALSAAGVDLIDCTSGGIGGTERPKNMTISQGFQVPFACQIKQQANIATMAVGFLWDAHHCEQIVAEEKADLVALGRELLANPNWPNMAAQTLGLNPDFANWPVESGWWLDKRQRLIKKLDL